MGCLSDTSHEDITVTLVPSANFGLSSPVCSGAPVTLTDSSLAYAPGTLARWYWDYGDGIRDTVNDSSRRVHTYNPWGSRTATLKVATTTGCTSPVFTRTFMVNPVPSPDFTLPAGLCLPSDSAHFFDASTIADNSTPFTYRWTFGDPPSGINDTSYIKNPVHYYNNAGPFTITLRVTSLAGCRAPDTSKVLSTVYPQTHADFSVNAENCLHDTTYLTDLTNATPYAITNWYWDFGDGQTAVTQNPYHIYAIAGTYTIRLHIKTDKGCYSDTMSRQVVINRLPTANFGYSALNCAGVNVTFTDSSVANSGAITGWKWDFGDGTILNLSNGNPVIHSFIAGTYTVTLTVTTSKGCKSAVLSRQVLIHPSPVPDFTMTPVCLPDGISNFTNSSTVPDGTTPASYAWNFGDPSSGGLNTSVLTNPSHRFSTVGPYTITLTATSINGCINSVSKQLTLIYPQPHGLFTVLPENCLHDTTFFTDQSNGSGSVVTEWHWNFGDGQTSVVQSPYHIYAAAGTYTVTLYIKTDKGCISDTMVKPVIINPLPGSSFTVSAPVCETKTVTFTSTSVANAGSITSWNWNLGDGTLLNLGNGAPFPHVYATTGTYTSTLSVQTNKGCKSGVATHTVVVHAQPTPNFILPGVCLSDAFAQFLDSSYIADGTDSSFTYLWNFGDPTSGFQNTSTLKNPVHRYLAAAIYTVTLTVTSSSGCSATKSKQLSVNGTVPKANFVVLNPNGLCSNTDVQIRDSSYVSDFGVITKIEIYWDNGGAPAVFSSYVNPPSYQVYSHLYPNFQSPLTRVYQVKLRAFSGGTCVDQKIQNVTINATPKVLFNAIPDTCLYISPFQITEASEVGGVPGTGVFTGAGVSASGIFDPSVAGIGAHVIRYTFTSNKGCVDFQDQTITVVAPPVAKFGYALPSCATKDVTFSDSSVAAAGTINRWTWNFGDGSAPVVRFSGSAFTHAFPSAQTYTVTLTVTTGAGCNSTVYTLAVKVNPLPVPSFAMPKICLPNAAATFTDNSTIADGTGSSFGYLWDFGDPNSRSK